MSFHLPLNFIDTFWHKAEALTYKTPLYDWRLRGDTPDRLVVKPIDPWPGDADKGQALLDAASGGTRTGPVWYNEWWSPDEADEIWTNHMHSFVWLRDLRTLGGAQAREQGRVMIESWINRYAHWDAHVWKDHLIGCRLSMWLCHYDYFCAHADVEFEDLMLSSILKQAKHLKNTAHASKGLDLFDTAKGLIYAGMSLEGHSQWLDDGLCLLEDALFAQVLNDGGHISRSPAVVLNVLEKLVDIRSSLQAGGRPVLGSIEDAINSMSSALRCLRYRDRKLSLFHGTQENTADVIDSILAQAGTHQKAKTSLPDMGFERLELGRAVLLMDTGTCAPAPYDLHAHASPLAFEFCYGKERLFTSCGTHPFCSNWQDALRFTAAHNTSCLDNRNACEIKKDGHFGRKVTDADVERVDADCTSFLTASHNGYVALNGVTHTRSVYLAEEGHDLRGEDQFICERAPVQPINSTARFHLHPNVRASLTNNGHDVLLRLNGGMGWRFRYSCGTLKLEDSLYLGHGCTPRKTQQIVIYHTIDDKNACLKWSLKHEK